MKTVLVLAAFLAVAAAQYNYQPPRQAYGAPQQEPEYQPQTYKHIYVHSAPDEPEERKTNTIRVPGGDKHVNIIFVKTPSQSSSSQTEVILPEQDQHKNLVYVLLKKAENTADVQVRRPAPTQPTKPEVYFIRYKDQEKPQGTYGAPAQGAPAQTYSTPQAQPQQQAQVSGLSAPARNAPASTYGTPY